MNKESLFRIGLGIATAAVAFEISQWSFYDKARKEILKRDGFECVGLYGQPCFFEVEWGEKATKEKGFYLSAAHYPHVHGSHNDDPSYGRTLCSCCHGTEELLRGNRWGAKRMLENGALNRSYVAENKMDQIYFNVDHLKEFVEEMRPFYEEYLYSLPARV